MLQIFPKDLPQENWLFYVDIDDKLELREQVKPFVCSNCGKYDEIEVLKKVGRHFELVPSCNYSAFGTNDDWVLVNEYTAKKVQEQSNCKLVPVNLSSTIYAIIPVAYSVSIENSGFEYSGSKCHKCGRHREAVVGPLSESILVPDNHDIFWTTDVHNESTKGIRLGLWCAKKDKKKVIGIFGNKFEFCEAF